MQYAIVQTPYGWLGLVGWEKGLRRIFLPLRSYEEMEHRIMAAYPGARYAPEMFGDVIDFLVRYFSGAAAVAAAHLDFSEASAFQKKVWRATLAIPYGEVRTYGDIARQIGNPGAVRAVGGALGKNPFPIVVPCHRVICSNGQLGGFSSPRGVELKKKLLAHEGIVIKHGLVAGF